MLVSESPQQTVAKPLPDHQSVSKSPPQHPSLFSPPQLVGSQTPSAHHAVTKSTQQVVTQPPPNCREASKSTQMIVSQTPLDLLTVTKPPQQDVSTPPVGNFSVTDTQLSPILGTECSSQESDMNLRQMVDHAFELILEEKRRNNATKTVKMYESTNKYLPEDIKKIKEASIIIDRARDGMSGQGADMCQEEYLKKGLSKVATGKINSFSVFRQVFNNNNTMINNMCVHRDGIRSAYFSDQMRGSRQTNRNKRRFKWGLEAMSASLLQMRREITDLDISKDLETLDEDLLDLRSKGLANLKTFFQQYITGPLLISTTYGGGG